MKLLKCKLRLSMGKSLIKKTLENNNNKKNPHQSHSNGQ